MSSIYHTRRMLPLSHRPVPTASVGRTQGFRCSKAVNRKKILTQDRKNKLTHPKVIETHQVVVLFLPPPPWPGGGRKSLDFFGLVHFFVKLGARRNRLMSTDNNEHHILDGLLLPWDACTLRHPTRASRNLHAHEHRGIISLYHFSLPPSLFRGGGKSGSGMWSSPTPALLGRSSCRRRDSSAESSERAGAAGCMRRTIASRP